MVTSETSRLSGCGIALHCRLSWEWDPVGLIVPGEMFWLVSKPGGQPESVHRLRKLIMEETQWQWLLVVLEDIRKGPGM